MAQLGHAIWATQTQRAAEFGRMLGEELDRDDPDIVAEVSSRPDLAGLVFQGLEEAMRVRAEEKLHLLAKVVAAAFAGDDARIDESGLFLRTAAALEPIDTRILVEVGRVRAPTGNVVYLSGTIKEADLAERVERDQRVFLKPVLQRLLREGLVVDEARGTWGYIEGSSSAYLCTPYGFRFLRHVPDGQRVWDGPSTVVGWFANDREIGVRNLGPVEVRIDSVQLKDQDGVSCYAGLVGEMVEPGDKWSVAVDHGDGGPPNGAKVTVNWTDDAGEHVFVTRGGE